MKRIATIALIILFVSNHQSKAQCNLSKPAATVTSWSSCDATLAWLPVPGAAWYQVRYRLRDESGWTILTTQVTDTFYTFTNLAADSAYKFGVAAFCSNGDGSSYKNAQKTLDKVSRPENLHSTGSSGSSVSIAWDAHCPTSSYNVRYKVDTHSGWTVISGLSVLYYTAFNLDANTLYDFQVQGLNGNDTSKWTKTVKVNSGNLVAVTKPNLIVYLMDDERYDNFSPNNGPSWFVTPSVSRVADEGINFIYSFPTTSQCGPSRVSIYSGLYATKHGAINNDYRHYDGIPLVQQILHNAGYFCGFVGKYGQMQGDPQGFDWWATSRGNVYDSPIYKINGVDTSFSGHITDVYQNLAMTFLNLVPPGKKFCLMFFTRVPHAPTTPRPQDTDLYTDDTMPFPTTFYPFTENYPSFLYKCGHNWKQDSTQTDSTRRQEFRCLYGVEVNMQAIFDWLTTHNQLDSTLVMFTSDNGYMEGEHMLEAKQLAFEESIRVPMFIRYPAWFSNPGEKDSTIMAFNVDIAPTLLDAAGIVDSAAAHGMDGVSLHQLYTGQLHRKYFYYQFNGDGLTPWLRAVRSTQYKYVKSLCNEATEEFYDLSIDPLENTNEINNAQYASIVETYRNVLDSIKTALNDTDPEPANCYLFNPEYNREQSEEAEALDLRNVEVYPNPSQDFFTVKFKVEQRTDLEMWITNLSDQKVYYKRFPNTNYFNMLVDGHEWAKGFYLVEVKEGSHMFSTKFLMQ